MSDMRRALHLAQNSKKGRVRKKNRHRIQNFFKIRINRFNFDFEGCLELGVKNVVFHEYIQPFERYIEQLKEDGMTE